MGVEELVLGVAIIPFVRRGSPSMLLCVHVHRSASKQFSRTLSIPKQFMASMGVLHSFYSVLGICGDTQLG